MRQLILFVMGMAASGAAIAQVTPALPAVISADTQIRKRADPVQIVDNQGKLAQVGVLPSLSTSAPGTIAAGGVYQRILAENTGRKGCVVYNKSAEPLQIAFGTVASATLARSIAVQPGGSISCGTPQGVVLADEVVATAATAGSAYLVVHQ